MNCNQEKQRIPVIRDRRIGHELCLENLSFDRKYCPKHDSDSVKSRTLEPGRNQLPREKRLTF